MQSVFQPNSVDMTTENCIGLYMVSVEAELYISVTACKLQKCQLKWKNHVIKNVVLT